ncbi:MAG TPA: SRPBCC family protein [Pseudobdellovibrionaceae bacterium]|nr:SRPBCC family protein [Pseudobdellovibrionaceae bacterium]
MKPKNNSNELTLTRVFDAPVKLVWEAWTDPNKAAQWWGPRGFSITTKSKDLRPGGKWIYTMHGPDGTDYPNITTYFVIEPLKRLQYDHGANENQKALFRVNVLFSESHGQTTMKMTMTFESSQIAIDMCKFIKEAGGNSTWDRLGEYLEEKYNNKNIFLLNRVFEAPIDVVFDMFTNPAHIEKWQPPSGFSMKILDGKIETGNSVFYEMGNNEVKFYGRSTYQKILRPEFISFYQEFCNEGGQNTKYPGAPVWPAMWLTFVTFTEEEASTTRITLKSEIIDNYSSDELTAFLAARGGMTQGWNGSFDRLEILLESLLFKT